MRSAIAASLAALFLTACATAPVTTALLTFETNPPGAKLYEGQVLLGDEPITKSYRVAEGANTVRTPEVTAVWPSGAKASFWTILSRGADEAAVIERPATATGLDKDNERAKVVMEARRKGEQKSAQQLRSDMARQSARCREQLASGVGAAVSSCQ
jgi:hypothetical protein